MARFPGWPAMAATVGVLTMQLTLHGNDSLKGKRKVAQSLKMKLRNKFNIAVSETDTQDSHVTLTLTAVAVSAQRTRVESQLTKAANMVEAIDLAELTFEDIELIDL